jgi:hypothetical protein
MGPVCQPDTFDAFEMLHVVADANGSDAVRRVKRLRRKMGRTKKGRTNRPGLFSANFLACLIELFSPVTGQADQTGPKQQQGRRLRYRSASYGRRPGVAVSMAIVPPTAASNFLPPVPIVPVTQVMIEVSVIQLFVFKRIKVELEHRRIHARSGTSALPAATAAEPQERMSHVGKPY